MKVYGLLVGMLLQERLVRRTNVKRVNWGCREIRVVCMSG